MSDKKHITRAAGTIGIASLLSRILGFIRDCVIAKLYGTTIAAQAFVIAFTVPGLLRNVVGEGVVNSAFIPVLQDYKINHSKEEFWQLANILLNVILVALVSLTILGVIFAPYIIRIVAPGFIGQPEKLAETVMLARVMFPYVLLIGLAAYGTSVLNSLKHFSISALGPCLMNIAMIAVPLMLFGPMHQSSVVLALAVLVGGVLQFSVQIPVLYKKGLRYRWKIDFKHPAVKQIGRFFTQRVFASGVYSISSIVNRIFSSLTHIVGEGAPAALYYADRVFQFPLAIFGIALGQAVLPTLSEQAQDSTLVKFKQTVSFNLRLILFISAPAAVIMGVLCVQITQVLFQHGRFDVYSTGMTANAVLFYSLGLIFYAGNNILVSAFYSLKDALAPIKAVAAAIASNIILNLLLMKTLKTGALALGTALAGVVSFILLFLFLRRKIGPFYESQILKSFLKILIASAFMGMILFILRNRFCLIFQYGSNPAKVLYLSAFLFAATAIYFITVVAIGLDEALYGLRWILRKQDGLKKRKGDKWMQK